MVDTGTVDGVVITLATHTMTITVDVTVDILQAVCGATLPLVS